MRDISCNVLFLFLCVPGIQYTVDCNGVFGLQAQESNVRARVRDTRFEMLLSQVNSTVDVDPHG
jgi:hypothetical protein